MPNPRQSELAALVFGAQGEARDLAERFIGGSISADQFRAEFARLLRLWHGSAWALGAAAAGDTAASEADQMLAGMVASSEQNFLTRFAADLASGRYVDAEGNINSAEILRRAEAYPRRMVGSANEALVTTSGMMIEAKKRGAPGTSEGPLGEPPAIVEGPVPMPGGVKAHVGGGVPQEPGAEEWWYWKLGPVEDHCDECPDLADGSPYLWDQLPTYPGANETPCMFNCYCWLVRGDGLEGFKQPGGK